MTDSSPDTTDIADDLQRAVNFSGGSMLERALVEIKRLRAENTDLRLRLTGHRRQEQFRASGRTSHVHG